jgi:hypothetical protein
MIPAVPGREPNVAMPIGAYGPFDAPSTVSAETRAEQESRRPGLFDRHPRAYSRWTNAEDDHLRTLDSAGLSVSEIAALHGRQPSAISSRLKKLGLR